MLIMKQITSSCAGLDCVTPKLLRDLQKNLQDFPYFHFPRVEPGWALSRRTLPSAPRKERKDSPAPARGRCRAASSLGSLRRCSHTGRRL